MRTLPLLFLALALALPAQSQNRSHDGLYHHGTLQNHHAVEVLPVSKSAEIPVFTGPSGKCQVTATLCPQSQFPLCVLCEKVDRDGVVWARVEISGWVQVGSGRERKLRRMMTRDHRWRVTSCAPVICSGKCRDAVPLARLKPCAEVRKVCSGLPDCGYIRVCFTGWVVKRCPRGTHLETVVPARQILGLSPRAAYPGLASAAL